MGPLSPTDLKQKVAEHIPQWMLNSVNDLLIKNFTGEHNSIVIYKDDIIDGALVNASAAGIDISRQEIFNKGYLNFEPAYEKMGWKVTYDSPGYNETYRANFTFKPKRSRDD